MVQRHGVDVPNGQEVTLQHTPGTTVLESPRRDRLTAELKLLIMELFKKTGDLSAACAAHGVEPRHIRYHIANDPAYGEMYREAWEEILDKCEGGLVNLIGNPKAVAAPIFLLKTRRARIYGDRQMIDVTHSVELTDRLADSARKSIETHLEVDEKRDGVKRDKEE